MSRLEDPGHERPVEGRIVNYADDFVICCRGTADEAMAAMRGMMSRLKLTVNEAKTRLCRVPEETFDFLGYTIGRCYSPQTGKAYIGTRPSAKKIAATLSREISELTGRRLAWLDERGAGGSAQQETAGLGELLLPGPGQPGVSGRGQAHLPPAPSVAACASTRCGAGG